MLELYVPRGLILNNLFILQMRKLSPGEGTCQGRTAEPNPRPWGSNPQTGAHFAPHPGLVKPERKSSLWQSFQTPETNTRPCLGQQPKKEYKRGGEMQPAVGSVNEKRVSNVIKVSRGPTSPAHTWYRKSRGQVTEGMRPKGRRPRMSQIGWTHSLTSPHLPASSTQ